MSRGSSAASLATAATATDAAAAAASAAAATAAGFDGAEDDEDMAVALQLNLAKSIAQLIIERTQQHPSCQPLKRMGAAVSEVLLKCVAPGNAALSAPSQLQQARQQMQSPAAAPQAPEAALLAALLSAPAASAAATDLLLLLHQLGRQGGAASPAIQSSGDGQWGLGAASAGHSMHSSSSTGALLMAALQQHPKLGAALLPGQQLPLMPSTQEQHLQQQRYQAQSALAPRPQGGFAAPVMQWLPPAAGGTRRGHGSMPPPLHFSGSQVGDAGG
jgi:hypothetical protein